MQRHIQDTTKQPTDVPKVTIVYAGDDLTEQDYPNLEIVGGRTDEPAGLFNSFIEEGFEENSIVGFVSNEYNLTTSNAISLMVEKLSQHTMVGAVYTDLIIKSKMHMYDKQWSVSQQYLPAFHPNLLKGELIVMSPVFMKVNLLTTQRFHVMLKKLYQALFFLTISQNILSCHIPMPLFERYHIHNDGTSLEQDYRYIQKWLTQLGT